MAVRTICVCVCACVYVCVRVGVCEGWGGGIERHVSVNCNNACGWMLCE